MVPSKTTRPFWLTDIKGILRHHEPILITRWQGESNCMIGPFSDLKVAEYYAHHVVRGQFKLRAQRIFPKRDAWYVEVGRDQGRSA